MKSYVQRLVVTPADSMRCVVDGIKQMPHPEEAAKRLSRRTHRPDPSRGDELVPFADHVAVLVHDRVPHADMPHALGERAAVSHRTGVFDLLADRAHDV